MSAPKRVWVKVWADGAMTAMPAPNGEYGHEYRLVKPKRETVAWIIRDGQKKGAGDYWFESDEDWTADKRIATRYPSEQYANDTRANMPDFDDTRVVRLVRRSTP